jgi:hypothetical protein
MLSWVFIPSKVFSSLVIESQMDSSSHELSFEQLAVLSKGALQSVAQRESRLDSPEPADPPGVSCLHQTSDSLFFLRILLVLLFYFIEKMKFQSSTCNTFGLTESR